MDLVARVKNIMLSPADEWRAIEREPTGPAILLQTHVACLAAIPAVADFCGMTLIGFTAPDADIARVGLLPAFLASLFSYAMSFAITSFQAGVILLLAPMFGARRDVTAAFKLAVYSYTPAWLAGIFLIVPGLHFLIMLGLYGLYILYKGMPLLIRCPPERALSFATLVTACGVVAALIVGWIRAIIFSLPGIL